MEVADGDQDNRANAPRHHHPSATNLATCSDGFHHHFCLLFCSSFKFHLTNTVHLSTYTTSSSYTQCPTRLSASKFIQPISRARRLTSSIWTPCSQASTFTPIHPFNMEQPKSWWVDSSLQILPKRMLKWIIGVLLLVSDIAWVPNRVLIIVVVVAIRHVELGQVSFAYISYTGASRWQLWSVTRSSFPSDLFLNSLSEWRRRKQSGKIWRVSRSAGVTVNQNFSEIQKLPSKFISVTFFICKSCLFHHIWCLRNLQTACKQPFLDH